jgi:mannose-6-phosphate isomerase-like protein (cupin superfamily)
MRPNKLSVLLPFATIGCVLAAPHSVWAQAAAPRSFLASPEIYKVIAENEQYRVIAATWKPGQRDNWHSHGAPAAGYNVTDCTVRLHSPDGKSTDIKSKAGDARVGAQVPSHSLENTGSAECKLILFEPK